MTKKWKAPAWLKPYVPMLVNTAGTFNDPEVAMNCDGKNCNLAVNGPRAIFCTAVQSQVLLLEKLHKAGMLTPEPGAGDE